MEAKKFEATLGQRIGAEVDRFNAAEEQLDPPARPTVVEEQIDNTVQTGASRDLGGPISIHAPWRRD